MYAVYNSQDNRTHSSIFGHAGRGRCDAARKCKAFRRARQQRSAIRFVKRGYILQPYKLWLMLRYNAI